MISSIASPAATPAASVMFDQQIQALNAQVARLESQISGFQEKKFEIQKNEKLSAAEKKEQIRSINEKISQFRERIQEVGARISEVQKRQSQAEKTAEKKREAAEERAPQADSGEEAGGVDRALLHAIIGIDRKPGVLNETKAQLQSRLREAEKEDMFRVRADGKMVMLPKEQRSQRDPVEAQNVRSRLSRVDSQLLRDKASEASALKKAAEDHPQTEKIPPSDENQRRAGSGTGRMEKGQYIENEA